ncbi:hypothetical protein [Methanonatronarchaeum sp. AMET6-2]|uniref:hypothetical protein n=1 Tax=Methanonatronarchaeum sp. AMET6-2 TaxID=2933293 RepID=UPI0012099109|nr:hypothetical protein [Methanonatronarchaeum sp. AMET6-2]RZN61735.1 MAG: hypothetical protein EF811_04725 [Methanonatronarchaeia archaeon]UOY10109.1 hypothetical protein MU439_00260 [Methanonatronarchaeum sp. AMET6-2]
MPRAHTRFPNKGSWVLGGDWDLNYTDDELTYLCTNEGYRDKEFQLIHIKNFVFYRSLEEHFKEGEPWRETDFYRTAVKRRISKSRYTTRRQIDRKLRELDQLYRTIGEKGYKTQRQLQKNNIGPFKPTKNKFHPVTGEVSINIGRFGQPIFNTGRHRFSIARIMDIKIPVRVYMRHEGWQDKRREVVDAENHDELSVETKMYLDHPDVECLLD